MVHIVVDIEHEVGRTYNAIMLGNTVRSLPCLHSIHGKLTAFHQFVIAQIVRHIIMVFVVDISDNDALLTNYGKQRHVRMIFFTARC